MVDSNHRRGFTLIELMVVVTIVGIIATLAIVRYSDTKQRAVVATVRSDMRNLAAMQETFLSGNGRYATTIEEAGFTPSEGVTMDILQSDGSGWSVKATSTAAGSVVCAAFFAAADPVAPATQEGIIACQ